MQDIEKVYLWLLLILIVILADRFLLSEYVAEC